MGESSNAGLGRRPQFAETASGDGVGRGLEFTGDGIDNEAGHNW
jgi:hypothetical protein